jgi:Fe-S oxidoreductase
MTALHHNTQPSMSPVATHRRALFDEAAKIAGNCVHCKLCLKECAFLQKYGTPGDIARMVNGHGPPRYSLAFECSLCGMCSAVCPISLTPDQMMLEMRRSSEKHDRPNDSSSCAYLGFEKRGMARHLTYYALPEGTSTIFFPGCALCATRPDATLELFDHLRRFEPTMGIVLDCCTKPSHDLGRSAFFETVFGEMRDYLVDNGIRRVLVACPSCYKIFKSYGGELKVETVYEVLLNESPPFSTAPIESVTIHDPCPFRFEPEIQSAVRALLSKKGMIISEMPHHGSKTFCCGEGASVSCVSPSFAKRWGQRRVREAQGRTMITYCAGCDGILGKLADTRHILDVLFETPHKAVGRRNPPGFPWTCWSRLKLKHRIKTLVPAAISREREIIRDSGLPTPTVNANRWTWVVSLWIAALFIMLVRFNRFARSKKKRSHN